MQKLLPLGSVGNMWAKHSDSAAFASDSSVRSMSLQISACGPNKQEQTNKTETVPKNADKLVWQAGTEMAKQWDHRCQRSTNQPQKIQNQNLLFYRKYQYQWSQSENVMGQQYDTLGYSQNRLYTGIICYKMLQLYIYIALGYANVWALYL